MKCEIDVCYRIMQNLLTQSLWNFACSYFKKEEYYGYACFESMQVNTDNERGIRMKSLGIMGHSYIQLPKFHTFLAKQLKDTIIAMSNFTIGRYSLFQCVFLPVYLGPDKNVIANLKDMSRKILEKPRYYEELVTFYLNAIKKNGDLSKYSSLSDVKVNGPGASFGHFVNFFGENVMLLWKVALLRKRILFFSPPPIGVVCYRGTTEKIFETKPHLYDAYVDNQNLVLISPQLKKILNINRADRHRFSELCKFRQEFILPSLSSCDRVNADIDDGFNWFKECIEVKISEGYEVVLAGDLNTRTGTQGYLHNPPMLPISLNASRNSKDEVISPSAVQFINFLEDNLLVIINGRTKSDENGEYTYISERVVITPDGPKSKPWFDRECYLTKKSLKSQLKIYTRSNSEGDRKAYALLKNKYSSLLTGKKKTYYTKIQERLKEVRDSAGFWKTISLFKNRRTKLSETFLFKNGNSFIPNFSRLRHQSSTICP
ncbi:KIAA1147 [Cordylochernes scorpioides]|uniref:KIAA1147 n=1 Tax=Cordylochernes scorpioides TaxID=51811 RepID=A0ABY6L849_9ARAC|nr:KIAA1147 [Cordylochernes scorpioides]